jgi:hypothetical protein
MVLIDVVADLDGIHRDLLLQVPVHSLNALSGLSPGADIRLVGRHDYGISSVPKVPYGFHDSREDHKILDAHG